MEKFIPSTAVVVELIPSEGLFILRQVNGALLHVCRDTNSVCVYFDDLSSKLLEQQKRVSEDSDIVNKS